MTPIAIAQESTTVGRNVATTEIPIDAPLKQSVQLTLSVVEVWVGHVNGAVEVVTGSTDSVAVGSESKH